MRPFLSVLTAVMLLVHTLLGCCAHHGHAAEEHDRCDHAVAESQLSAFETVASDAGHEDGHDDEHSIPHGCEEDGRCQFVTSAAGASPVATASPVVPWESLLPAGHAVATKTADYRADNPNAGDCCAEDLALGVLRI